MTIHIEALTFETIIGLLDFERTTLQRIEVNLELAYHYEERFINYADITALIKTDLQQQQYLLLEEALQGLKETLCSTYPQINTLWIKLTKPDILPDCQVSLSEKWVF